MGKPNPQNLKPCKPGETHNPNGRPKGSLNRSTIVRRWLELADKTGMTEADKLVLAALAKGKKGDIQAFNSLMDSGYGKLTDKREESGPNGGPIVQEIKVSFGS